MTDVPESKDVPNEKAKVAESPKLSPAGQARIMGVEPQGGSQEAPAAGAPDLSTKTKGEIGERHAVDVSRATVSDDTKVQHVTEDLRKMRELQPDEWQKLSDEERVEVLSRASSLVAREYGIDSPQFALHPDSRPGAQGYYDRDTNTVYLNPLARQADRHSSWEDPRAALDNTLHETRHAYQHAVAEDLDRGRRVDDRAETWRDNLENYVRPEQDFRRYWRQPVERDARDFAARVRAAM